MQLTKFQKRLCNGIQSGLEICDQPFGQLAERVGAKQDDVIENLNILQRRGYLKHIRALINYKALGRKSTLVAAHIEQDKLGEVTEKINSLPNVSHNYLREHYYNLWFTLQGESEKRLQAQIDELSKKSGTKFCNLPAVKTYKLDTRFDVAGNCEFMEAPLPLPSEKKVDLSEKQNNLTNKLQNPLPITPCPFEKLGRIEISEILELYRKGTIRRIAGIVNYRKLGFTENVLLALNVEESEIDNHARNIAKLKQVSHCYKRKPCEDFNYNLFVMLHGRSKEEIKSVIRDIITLPYIKSHQQLPTTAELKKQPVSNS